MKPIRTLSLSAISLLLLISLFGCVGTPDLSRKPARELFDDGMDYYQREKYRRAIDNFQTLTFNYPGQTMIDTAQYYLGLSYFGDKDYALASTEFNRLIANFPASPFAPQAHLMRAVAKYESAPRHFGLDQTETVEALQMFEDFLIDFPESEAITDAKAYIQKSRSKLAEKEYTSGIVYMRVRDPRAAKIYFQKVVDDYIDTKFGPLATYQLGEAEFVAKDWPVASQKFENFAIVFPDHELTPDARERSCEALYRWGREALEDDELGRARTRFERFMEVCSTESKRYEKVAGYLEELPEVTETEAPEPPETEESQTSDDDS